VAALWLNLNYEGYLGRFSVIIEFRFVSYATYSRYINIVVVR